MARTTTDELSSVLPYSDVAGALGRELLSVEARLAELRDAPKASFLGSARVTRRDDYWRIAFDVAARFAGAGWWVITGGGPGIMEAATRGAGPAATIALRIRAIDSLRAPGAPDAFGEAAMAVELTQLFARKLIMMWESTCFVAFPGGFGTLDEIFELLTMMQTQLAPPRPILLIEKKGDSFWSGMERAVWKKLSSRGFIDRQDERFLIRATPNDPIVDKILSAASHEPV
jgi:uncharacterized protein (TIGR00730 family)